MAQKDEKVPQGIRVREHLEALGVEIPRCPVCQSLNWAYGDQLVAIPGYDDDRPELFRPTVNAPVAILICTTCYYFMPFLWLPIKAKLDGDRSKK